jgi:hypothetical protein
LHHFLYASALNLFREMVQSVSDTNFRNDFFLRVKWTYNPLSSEKPMKYPKWIVALSVVWSLSSAFGQSMKCSMASGNIFTAPDRSYKVTITYNPLPVGSPGVLPGRPFSAEEIAQRTQTLPDGTKVVDPRPSTFHYRDSAGRTRTERPLMMSTLFSRSNIPVVPEIFDPVAGYCYYLDTVNRVAHRILLKQPIQTMVPPQGLVFPAEMPAIMMSTGPMGARVAPSAQPTASTERLGTRMIEGVETTGTRTTTTYPAGAMGNDQPITTFRENWIAPELNATVLSKVNDPRQGEDLQAMVHINREDPDGSYFTVPRGYKIVEETLPFNITFSGHSN